MLPIRQTVALSCGHVTLTAWPAPTEGGLLSDLLALTVALGALHDAGEDWKPEDAEPHVLAAFWRLLDASLLAPVPGPLTWADVLTLLNAMWTLNDVEELEKKLLGLMERAGRLLERLRRQARENSQGHPTER